MKWELALRFFSLQDANVRYVLFGSMLLAGATGVIGCFAFLRKRSLVGDAIAHAALPGVCLAYLLFESKEPYVLLAGAILAGWGGTLLIDFIRENTRLKEDAAIAIVLSVFFGAGIALLTVIQHSGRASQAGLDKFLFGQAASLMSKDVWVLGVLALLLWAAVWLAFKEFKVYAFDPEFARGIGLPVRGIEIALTTLIVAGIAIGLQMVGIVLMAALLITPAAAARQWTDHLPRMVILAGVLGALSGAAGAFTSALAPRMPTGPWMVVTVTFFFVASLLFAPRRGVAARVWRQAVSRATIAAENVVTTLYRLDEREGAPRSSWPPEAILRYRPMTPAKLEGLLRRLFRQGLVAFDGRGWALSEEGESRARRIVRRHRLWELYLTEQLQLPAHRVHQDAEEIEHWLSQAQEEELVALLDQPLLDPHAREIPRIQPG